MKKYIYFYKEEGRNIPVITGESSDLKDVLFPGEKIVEHIQKKVPNSKKNLYALVDGTEFYLRT